MGAGWLDEVSETRRQRQYSRELLFSTVVEPTTLVSLRLRPSLHAAARGMPGLPVSLASLYVARARAGQQPSAWEREAPGTPARIARRGTARAVAGVYDPDLGLVVDLVACEDTHASAQRWRH